MHACTQVELREQKQSTDRTLKEVDAFAGKVSKLGEELKEQVTRNMQMATDNATRVSELESKQAEINSLRAETRRLGDLKSKLDKRIESLNDKRAKADGERDHLKQQVRARARARVGVGCRVRVPAQGRA